MAHRREEVKDGVQGPGKCHPPGLATGDLVRIPLLQVHNTHPLQQGRDPVLRIFDGNAFQSKEDILPDIHVRPESRSLEHKTYPAF